MNRNRVDGILGRDRWSSSRHVGGILGRPVDMKMNRNRVGGNRWRSSRHFGGMLGRRVGINRNRVGGILGRNGWSRSRHFGGILGRRVGMKMNRKRVDGGCSKIG
mgnify:CR=1 FL=1